MSILTHLAKNTPRYDILRQYGHLGPLRVKYLGQEPGIVIGNSGIHCLPKVQKSLHYLRDKKLPAFSITVVPQLEMV